MTGRRAVVVATGLALAVAVALVVWVVARPGTTDTGRGAAPAASPDGTAGAGGKADGTTGRQQRSDAAGGAPDDPRVLAISVDGLTPGALRVLGRDGAPAIWSLIDEGASTLDARADHDLTITLPNHVGMLTGRWAVAPQGHGVDWNDDRDGDVVPGDGTAPVESILTRVHDAGGSTAVFAGKPKFDIFPATWPDAVDASVYEPDLRVLTGEVARDLRRQKRELTFFHVAEPDVVGHDEGWMSGPYLDAVAEADAAVGRVLRVLERSPALARSTTVVLTADHGGEGRSHGDPENPKEYRIPFVVAGPTVRAGDLYAGSSGLVDPGRERPEADDPTSLHNCDLANVAAALLQLSPVPGSTCRAADSLTQVLGVDRVP